MSVDQMKTAKPVMAPRPLTVTELLLAYPNLVRALSVGVFLVLWEVLGRNVDPIFMTYPSAIVTAGVGLVRSGELIRAFGQSLVPFSIGMVISILFGLLIGLAMGMSRLVEYALDPFINAMNAIPRIALVPLIVLWCGLGIYAKTVIVVSLALFPMIINTYAGVRDVRGPLVEVGVAYAATHGQLLRKIILPAALPFIMTGIRLALGLGIIGMIVAEFFTAVSGLGGVIINYGNTFQTAKMFVAIVLVGVMGVVLSELVMMLERRWTSWRHGEAGRR